MAEPQRVNFTETPEFREAVKEAAAAAVAEALALARHQASTSQEKSDGNWVQALAMEMATLTDQGIGRRVRVSPEEISSRKEARERMMQLLIDARAQNKTPSYQLTNKVQLDDQLVDPFWIDRNHIAQPTEIDWPGVPNEVMIPINDVAKEIYGAFQKSIGTLPKEHVIPDRALKITAGGLVVKGGPTPGMRQTGAPAAPGANNEGLKLRHKDEPGRYKDVNILGSIAPPARQTI